MMATNEELQQQIAALTARVDAITAPPTDYYTSRYSGEEADNAVARALPGGEIDASLSNKVNLPVEILFNADLNDYTTPGMYYCSADAVAVTINNSPVPHAFSLMVELLAPGEAIQTLTTWISPNGYRSETYKRCQYPVGWSNRWVRLATATPPQEYDLPLAVGISVVAGAKSVYSKDQFGRVLVHIAAQKSEAFASGQNLIATLPVGYRPEIAVHSVGWCTTSTVVSGVYIHPDGNLYVNVTGPSQGNILGQLSFIAT